MSSDEPARSRWQRQDCHTTEANQSYGRRMTFPSIIDLLGHRRLAHHRVLAATDAQGPARKGGTSAVAPGDWLIHLGDHAVARVRDRHQRLAADWLERGDPRFDGADPGSQTAIWVTRRLLRVAPTDIAADFPAARILDIADLVVADRRDGVDRNVTHLAGRRDDAHERRKIRRVLRHDAHEPDGKLVDNSSAGLGCGENIKVRGNRAGSIVRVRYGRMHTDY